MADSASRLAGKLRILSPSNANPLALQTPWPQRRHTPYAKTPRTGRISRIVPKSFNNVSDTELKNSYSLNSQKPAPPNDSESGIRISKSKHTPVNPKLKVPNSRSFDAESIVNKTWRVYRLSPLFNFKYEEEAFKKYGRLLAAHLEAESQRKIALEVEATSNIFKANFTVVKGISSSRSDCDSVEVAIKTTTNNQAGTTKKKDFRRESSTLVALFCSVGREDDENAEPILKNNFTSLPVCLVKGPANLVTSLASWVETQFDCRMSLIAFSPVELGWFAALWAGVVTQNRSKPIELCYSLPPSVKGLSHITVDIEGKDAHRLWLCVHNNNSDIFTEPEATIFLRAIEVHFYQHFKIDLSNIPLTRVGTSVACVGSEGRLKILHPGYIQHVLHQVMQTSISRELLGRL